MSVPNTAPVAAVTQSDPAGLDVDALIIGVVQGPDGPELAPGVDQLDAAFDGGLTELLALLGVAGKPGEVVKVPTRGAVAAKILVAAGLGKPAEDGTIGAEQVRRAAGAAARALAGIERAATTLSSIDLTAAAEGVLLGSYSYRNYKSERGDAPLGHIDLVTAGADDTQQVLDRAVAVATAVRTARDLVNTPPNDLYPASFAERASELGKSVGLEVEVLDEAALQAGGYGGILGVGGGSTRPPRLVRLRYCGGENVKKVALVGKGITFDTGGISLKPAANMDNMTSDMGGAAAVVATVALAATLKLPLEVTATVPMAENMPSGAAYRPGDVLNMYGGKTVEVLNTDAEGRLILADAIVRACEDEPDYLIETATLTGAQLVALGTRTSGVMGSDEFRDRVTDHAKQTGEGAWAMPLPDELREGLDSKLADLANVSGQRWGGMLVAGVFLREFVAEGIEWAHVDIAGPSYNTDAAWGYTGKGGTGVPVRTFAAVLEDIAANG